MRLVVLLCIVWSSITLAAPLPKELRRNCPVEGRWTLKHQSLGESLAIADVTMIWVIAGEKLTVSTIPAEKFRFVKRAEEGEDAYDYVSYDETVSRCRIERKQGTLRVAMPIDDLTRPQSAKPGTNILYFEFQLVQE